MKKAFATGVVILLPALLTIMLFIFLIDLFTTPFLGIVKNYLYHFEEENNLFLSKEAIFLIARMVTLVLMVLFTLLLGVMARWFLVHWLLEAMDKLFSKTPFIRTIFTAVRDVAKALFKPGKKSREAFRYPVMTPFPAKESDSIGFVTGYTPKACSDKIADLVPVFVPTAPHPISGYLLLVPKNKVTNINMTSEDALKFTLSCGMILPKDKKSNEPPQN